MDAGGEGEASPLLPWQPCVSQTTTTADVGGVLGSASLDAASRQSGQQ